MSLENCIKEAKDWAAENEDLGLSARDIEEVGRLLQAADQSGVTAAERAALMQEIITKRLAVKQAAERGENILNSIKNQKNGSNAIANFQAWAKAGANSETAPVKALEALMTGKSSRPGLGVNQDPISMYSANAAKYMGALENVMPKEELQIFKSMRPEDTLNRKVIQELDALRQKTPSGKSGSDIAMSIAKHLREAQDVVFHDVQGINPYLRENNLYLFTRSHSADKIGAVSKDAWMSQAMQSYGDSIIGSPEDKAKVLGEMYDRIKSGLPPEGAYAGQSFWEPQGASGSQAKQASGGRVLQAKNWQAEADYQAKFGESLYQAYMRNSLRQADYAAQATKWGTKASDNFESVFRKVYQASTDEQKARLLKEKPSLMQTFASTTTSRGGEPYSLTGRIAQGVMATENLSMLGGHSPRMLTAPVAMIAQIRDGYGLNYFEAATEVAKGMARMMKERLPGGNAQAEMLNSGGMFRSAQRDMAGQVYAGDQAQLGFTGKVLKVAGALNLADYTNNSLKLAMVTADTHILGNNLSTSFDNLHPKFQENLGRYGIGGKEWSALQAIGTDSEGRLSPIQVMLADKDKIAPFIEGKVTGTKIQQFKSELSTNLGTYLNERGSMSVAESNAASRYSAYGLADINQPMGAARYFLMQYKQAMITRQQLLARTFRSGGGNTSNMSGALEYALGTGFMGMVAQQLIELGSGRTPMDPTDPRMMKRMIESTGALGMYGNMLADTLLPSQPNMERQALQSDIIGPTFGNAAKLGEATARTIYGMQHATGSGSNEYGQRQWARFLTGLVPGQNIFYAKGALDYLLLNQAHEFLGDTGHAGLVRKQMQKSAGLLGIKQDFTFGGDNAFQ